MGVRTTAAAAHPHDVALPYGTARDDAEDLSGVFDRPGRPRSFRWHTDAIAGSALKPNSQAFWAVFGVVGCAASMLEARPGRMWG